MNENNDKFLPHEIVHTVKHENAKAPKDYWKIAQTVSVIFSALVIPLIISFYGGAIEDRLSARNTSQAYIELAVNILTKPKSTDEDNQNLRHWAVSLINENSPIKLSTKLATQLEQGSTTFPHAGERNASYYMIKAELIDIPKLVSEGKHDEARRLIENVVEAYLEYYGSDHPDYKRFSEKLRELRFLFEENSN